MYQVFNADWSVSVLRLRSVEQALELTQDVLGYILAGDSDRVAALSGFEISPRLRSTTLAGSRYLSGVDLDRCWFTRPGGLRCAT